jgi:acetyl esterase/lipase
LEVLFIHGLSGHHFKTWALDGKEENYWPKWIEADVPGSLSLSFEYPAPLSVLGSNDMALPDRARNALQYLVNKRTRNRPVIVVVHSMGGLLIKQMLRAAADGTIPASRPGPAMSPVSSSSPRRTRVRTGAASWATSCLPRTRRHSCCAAPPGFKTCTSGYARKRDLAKAVFYETEDMCGVARIVQAHSARLRAPCRTSKN